MLIINADDWGRSQAETDAALDCYKNGRITSVSAMVFMRDSERAAELAKANQIDVGLHLNFSESFTGNHSSKALIDNHRIALFLTRNKYAPLLYNPFLREEFACSCQAQLEEFVRLFGQLPSHLDGHHHMHLCANILLSKVIPAGMKMRRNFSFWPGEKSPFNRAYRGLVDRWLARKYRLPDYFFDLSQCMRKNKFDRVLTLAKSGNVELMTHPVLCSELEYLMSDRFGELLHHSRTGTYAEMALASLMPSQASTAFKGI